MCEVEVERGNFGKWTGKGMSKYKSIKIIWNKIWDARNGLERVKERTSEAISFLIYLNIFLDS